MGTVGQARFARARVLFVFGAMLVGCGGAGDTEPTGASSEAYVVCGSGASVEGVDVSYYQGNIDWNAVHASGREFAFARVSDGTGFVDPKFSANWAGIKNAGMIRGVYQFFRPGQSALAQANLLLSYVDHLEPGDLPPVLDVEAADGVSRAGVAAGITTWVNRVQSVLGVTPIVYTGQWFWDSNVGGGVPPVTLWAASWGGSCPSLPSAFGSWKFWQYSDSGYVPGIGSVDVDRWNGTLAELRAFANLGGGSNAGLPSLGGSVTSGVSVGSNADGRLEVFARGNDAALWTTFQTAPNAGWSSWYSLGGAIEGTPAVASNADGRLEVFARTGNGSVWHAWQGSPNGSIGGWVNLGGVVTSDPIAAKNADGRLEVFARGTDGAVWHAWQVAPNSGWSKWWQVNGTPAHDPRVAKRSDGALVLCARGDAGNVIVSEQTSAGWTAFDDLGGWIDGAPACGVNADGRLEVFGRGGDGALYHRWENAARGTWSDWYSLGGDAREPVVASNADGRLIVFVRGADDALYRIEQASSGWSAWTKMGGSLSSASAAAPNADGRLEVFARASSTAVVHAWQSSPGSF